MKLLLAGLCVRSLAQAACAQGFAVVALDVFGDAETRAAATHWVPVGDAATLAVDAARLHAGLTAHADGALGWMATGGLEPLTDWPQVPGLPLLGERGPVRAADWLAALDELGLPHPPSRSTPPHAPQGWLRKTLTACGGAGVTRSAGAQDARGPSVYWQREGAGQPISLTFIANGCTAIGVGVNRQFVHDAGPAQPFQFLGLCGALPVPAAVADALVQAAQALALRFGLRGLGSLDALWTSGHEVQVLEVNARVPASHAAYPDAPLLHWHLAACAEGALPPAVRPGFALTEDVTPHGFMTVFAPEAGVLDAPLLRLWASRPGVHDVAPPETAPLGVAAAAPLCSVSAQGGDLAARLAAARTQCLADWRAHHVH